MTIDNVFTYAGAPATAAAMIGVGVATLICAGALFAWLTEFLSGKAALITLAFAAASMLTAPILSTTIDTENNALSRSDAVEVWLEEEHGLTLVAGSAPEKDAVAGLLDNRLVIAIDAEENLHTIQFLPLDENTVTIINGERIQPEGSYYLSDPETGQEFNLEAANR